MKSRRRLSGANDEPTVGEHILAAALAIIAILACGYALMKK